MRLRFQCEMETAFPIVVSSSLNDYVEGCLCAYCAAYRERQQQQPQQPKPVVQKPQVFETHGMVVLESTPQFRTILTTSNKGLARLAFPYLIHVIAYQKVNQNYVFPGIFGSGLRVFFRNSPMEDYESLVAPAATDYSRYGVVCSPHEDDNRVFTDLHEMCNFVVSKWWNTPHCLQFAVKEWPQMNLQQAIDFKWGDDNTIAPFPKALENTIKSGYGKNKSFYPPVNSTLIDEPWQSNKQLLLKD